MAELRYFKLELNHAKTLPLTFWMREWVAEISWAIVGVWKGEEEVNFWDIRVIGMICLIPFIYLATPAFALYVKKEVLIELKDTTAFQTHSKTNQEYLTVYNTLRGTL